MLLKDLPSIYGISDVQELNSLFTMIAYHSGSQFSYEALSKESGIRKDLLRKYIEYLEAAYLIKVIHRTDDTAKSYQREISFKIYLTNPSLRCALFQPLKEADDEMGEMVETTVFAQWAPRSESYISYANWKNGRKDQGEVDIVGINPARLKPDWAVEVKWTNRYYENPGELLSLKSYMEKNELECAIVTTKTIKGKKEMPFGMLQFIPVACYTYNVAKNTLRSAKSLYGI